MEPIEIVEADLDRDDHQRSVLNLIDAYARDPMGNGEPLPSRVKNELIPGLRNHPTTLIFLAWCDGRAVGIAVCFIGFSTFAARPLINIHDLAVLPEGRGNGVGRKLLAALVEGRFESSFKGQPSPLLPEEPEAADDDWENRRLCPDGNCICVIGPDGRCKECGRSEE